MGESSARHRVEGSCGPVCHRAHSSWLECLLQAGAPLRKQREERECEERECGPVRRRVAGSTAGQQLCMHGVSACSGVSVAHDVTV